MSLIQIESFVSLQTKTNNPEYKYNIGHLQDYRWEKYNIL